MLYSEAQKRKAYLQVPEIDYVGLWRKQQDLLERVPGAV